MPRLTASIVDQTRVEMLEMTSHFDGLTKSAPVNLQGSGTAISLSFEGVMMQLVFAPVRGKITFNVQDLNCNLWPVPPEFVPRRVRSSHRFHLENVRMRVTRVDGRFRMTVRSTHGLTGLKRFFALTLERIQDAETDTD
jgi:hypothetical protein